MDKKQVTVNAESQTLKTSAKKASESAIRVSKALALNIKFIEGAVLLEQKPDGTRTKIRTIKRVRSLKKNIQKGTQLCLPQKG